MLEHDVSVQLAATSPRLTTWNQRPVFGSWYVANPATRRRTESISAARLGWLAGSTSRVWRVAIPYQPIARHQYCEDRPVVLFAQLWLLVSS